MDSIRTRDYDSLKTVVFSWFAIYPSLPFHFYSIKMIGMCNINKKDNHQ